MNDQAKVPEWAKDAEIQLCDHMLTNSFQDDVEIIARAYAESDEAQAVKRLVEAARTAIPELELDARHGCKDAQTAVKNLREALAPFAGE